MQWLVLLTICLAAPIAESQQMPTVDELLNRLHNFTVQYRSSLPSLSCEESIVSQRLKDGQVKSEVRMEATLREIRKATPDVHDPFTEQREIRTVDGKPPKKNFKVPYFVHGGFANGIGFVQNGRKDNLDYRLTPSEAAGTVRLEITAKPGATTAGPDAAQRMVHSVVVADAATGQIRHMERTITAEYEISHKDVYFMSEDYAPQSFGGETLWLPVRFFAHNAADDKRFYDAYSNCHRYTGELRILPNATVELQ